MKCSYSLLKVTAFGLLAATIASGQSAVGTWAIDHDTDMIAITTAAIESQSCRETPTTLTITCAAEALTMTVESGCEADTRPWNNSSGFETDVLLTFEFVNGASVLFDDSAMYPFETNEAARTLHLEGRFVADLVKRMMLKPTFATSVDLEGDGAATDSNGQFARMTSHFDTSELASTLRQSGMHCGIRQLLE